MNILPVDLPNLFLSALEENKREPDGKLHASSDLNQPLRFVQLRAAGAPTVGRPIAQDIRLLHGTLWHDWFHSVLEKSGIEFMYEVKLDEYLPEGWSGTADWIFWHPEYEAYVLGDLKTIKGEGIHWIGQKGAKDEHVWQLSAYWHALAKRGIPLVEGFGIMYWPMNDTREKVDIVPTVQECSPLPEDVVYDRMRYVKDRVDRYIESLDGDWITEALEPMPEREQKLIWSGDLAEVKLVPVWWESYCDFDETLCPRSGVTKIGHYTPEGYIPRKGYEETLPTVEPSKKDMNRRWITSSGPSSQPSEAGKDTPTS